MGQFIACMEIKVEHGYYTNIPSNFRIQPTLKTMELMRRRGVLCRQTMYGWQWLMEKECAGFLDGDEFEFSFQPLDSDFILVTQLYEYFPQLSYRLTFIGGKQVVDVAATMVPHEACKMQSEFCRLCIRPTDEMLKSAKDGIPQEYVLQFRGVAYRWEYLFIMRSRSPEASLHLVLEEVKNRITFEEVRRMENSLFGEGVWQTFSKELIDYKEHSDYRIELSEVLPGTPTKKRLVSRFIPTPRPGAYWSDRRDCIRQICYI